MFCTTDVSLCSFYQDPTNTWPPRYLVDRWGCAEPTRLMQMCNKLNFLLRCERHACFVAMSMLNPTRVSVQYFNMCVGSQ